MGRAAGKQGLFDRPAQLQSPACMPSFSEYFDQNTAWFGASRAGDHRPVGLTRRSCPAKAVVNRPQLGLSMDCGQEERLVGVPQNASCGARQKGREGQEGHACFLGGYGFACVRRMQEVRAVTGADRSTRHEQREMVTLVTARVRDAALRKPYVVDAGTDLATLCRELAARALTDALVR